MVLLGTRSGLWVPTLPLPVTTATPQPLFCARGPFKALWVPGKHSILELHPQLEHHILGAVLCGFGRVEGRTFPSVFSREQEPSDSLGKFGSKSLVLEETYMPPLCVSVIIIFLISETNKEPATLCSLETLWSPAVWMGLHLSHLMQAETRQHAEIRLTGYFPGCVCLTFIHTHHCALPTPPPIGGCLWVELRVSANRVLLSHTPGRGNSKQERNG